MSDNIEDCDSALITEDCALLRQPVEASRFMDGQHERLQSYLLNQDLKELVQINHGCYRHNVYEKQILGNSEFCRRCFFPTLLMRFEQHAHHLNITIFAYPTI